MCGWLLKGTFVWDGRSLVRLVGWFRGFLATPRKTNIINLKINCWKMYFLLKSGPFLRDIRSYFRGCTVFCFQIFCCRCFEHTKSTKPKAPHANQCGIWAEHQKKAKGGWKRNNTREITGDFGMIRILEIKGFHVDDSEKSGGLGGWQRAKLSLFAAVYPGVWRICTRFPIPRGEKTAQGAAGRKTPGLPLRVFVEITTTWGWKFRGVNNGSSEPSMIAFGGGIVVTVSERNSTTPPKRLTRNLFKCPR